MYNNMASMLKNIGGLYMAHQEWLRQEKQVSNAENLLYYEKTMVNKIRRHKWKMCESPTTKNKCNIWCYLCQGTGCTKW